MSRSRNPTAAWSSTVSRGAAPNTLFRQGWRKDDLKIGEAVTVNGIRAKAANSFNVGQATITTADGRKVYGQGAGGGAK